MGSWHGSREERATQSQSATTHVLHGVLKRVPETNVSVLELLYCTRFQLLRCRARMLGMGRIRSLAQGAVNRRGTVVVMGVEAGAVSALMKWIPHTPVQDTRKRASNGEREQDAECDKRTVSAQVRCKPLPSSLERSYSCVTPCVHEGPVLLQSSML